MVNNSLTTKRAPGAGLAHLLRKEDCKGSGRLGRLAAPYLAHALARDAELVGELLERDRFFGEPARLEDARSRSLSTESAEARALRRPPNSSLAASVVSWSRCSSTNQSCHSLELPSSRIGASSDTSPPRRRFMSTTSCSVTPRRLAMSLTWSGRKSPSSSTEILLLALRRLKKSFFWLTVVPIFTRDHERRMYSWIAALIHHMA